MSTSTGSGTSAVPVRVTGWVGFIWFAAVLMMLSGVFSMLWGIVAIGRDSVFPNGRAANAVNLSYPTWGWIILTVGIVVFISGCALFTGSRVAAIIALALAAISAISNLLVLGADPVWSVIEIALAVLVIWAITFHLHELRDGNY